MENSHDIILIIVIGAIILLQIYVFINNYIKIRNYKNTIKMAKEFEIVEVTVPDEWIKDLEVEDILKDPVGFQNSSSEFHEKIKSSSSSEFDDYQ
ncbi:MAG: hypothetical protein LAT51_09050 [Flavobacteriaceae bacterium]|nr:hypothetical protein [Flavobacteriaceae bacterium]